MAHLIRRRTLHMANDIVVTGGLTLHAEPLGPAGRQDVASLLRDAGDHESLFGVGRNVTRETLVDAWCDPASSDLSVVFRTREGQAVALLRVTDGALSYVVEGSMRRRGIATAIVGWVLGLPHVRGMQLWAQVARDNVPSRRVLEAAGFRFIGPVTCGPGAQPLLHFTVCLR
jgi:GNAT superfamily N-acetyltransferase